MIKRFFLSVNKGTSTSNLTALVLRLGFGILMIPKHGYAKLVGFNELKGQFVDFMGLGSTLSLGLAVFAEFFCSILLVLGLFTRFAALSLLITSLVILSVHDWQIFGKYELGTAFFIGYLAILIQGPGKYSLDYLIFKKGR
ncbi:DoxX family protein [Sphingobacterium wenxiniae]|uniref:Putative oxidoreductase n=1 Tax=Sphingobacterium wenxiniae TaxID=683125 RepID=A0A1I6Q4X9_9SPHI|nr:DoxX family protein [Sphingobacterium wenxiniae]SFS47375.1 putative oxidoreductase [Sphingobacterium wenxiniae]